MWRQFLLLILLSTALMGWGKTVDLMKAVVPVSDQSSASLQSGLQQGLAQVLVKASGNSSIMTLPKLQQSEANAQQYVLSYHFQADQGQTNLLVNYDPKAIKKLIVESGQSWWGANRPLTLVWLALPTKAGWQFVDGESNNEAVQALRQQADKRGMPILFPTLDLQDQAAMGNNPNDWLQPAHLQAGAKRYQVKSQLVGEVNQGQGGWQSRWLLLVNQTPISWQEQGDSESAVIVKGVDQAADYMANQFVLVQGGENTVTLQVMQVGGLKAYASLVHYLQSVSVVNQVDTINMGDDSVRLKLDITGSVSQLQQVLTQDAVLKAIQSCQTAACQSADLVYQYHGSTN